MNAYARLAIFLGIAVAILIFATQHALDRGADMSQILNKQPAAQARTNTSHSSSAGLSTGTATTAIQSASKFQTTPQGTPDLFAQLEALAAGPEAIALTQKIEAGITPENTPQYVAAFLSTQNAAVERATSAALARTADSATVSSITSAYGNIPEQSRGRILTFLESVQNPAAYQGLIQTVKADTSEKGSPILGSAMHGMANLGTNESVAWLLSQLNGDREFFALQSLSRVQSPAGRATMEGAVAGNKDGAGLDPDRVKLVAGILAQGTAK
jgi:hypothetical protein